MYQASYKVGFWGQIKKATDLTADTGPNTEHQKRLKSHLSDIGMRSQNQTKAKRHVES